MKCTVHHAQSIMESLVAIYEVVRLVDPAKHKMITFNENDEIIYDKYECYRTWNKEKCCKNCVSIHAIHKGCRMTKFEFVDNDIYHVVSKPFEMICKNGNEVTCALEIVAKITDEILFDTAWKQEFTAKIIESEEKLYLDSLTKVYNRRYFDERGFCHNDRCDLEDDVTFVMIDLKEFKRVNDEYGHTVGDWVLEQTAQTIRANVRVSDSVIRLGGDEFLLVLNKCKESDAGGVMQTIEEKLRETVVYDREKNRYAIVNFGIAATSNFVDSTEFIADLMREADAKMYEQKRGLPLELSGRSPVHWEESLCFHP